MAAVLDHGHGILAVDSFYEGEDQTALHAVVEGGRAAIIDTGVNRSVPGMLAALAARGVAPEAVDWIFLTHVHLDHAGGTGEFARLCPNARVAVHPRGARHMADPSKLMTATRAIYGEEATRRIYGEVLPVPRERIVEVPDGAVLALGRREFRFLDVPGHARHHVAIVDGATGHVFAGDTFGISYRALDAGGKCFVFPTTSPSQFDPGPLHHSIERIVSLGPAAIYVTHFSKILDVSRLSEDLHRLIDAHVELALAHRRAGIARHHLLREGVRELLVSEGKRQGWGLSGEALLERIALDIELNAQGLGAWLDALPE